MGTTTTIDDGPAASPTPPQRPGIRQPFDRSDDVLNNDPRRVMAQVDGVLICAEYSEQTGQLCLRQDGTLLREWFPPHSWMAIASVAGARHWGTRPTDDDLLALLRNEMALLRS
jgi:hypothetical protein